MILLEEIQRKKELYTDMSKPVEIQDYPNTWEEIRLWFPRRSLSGKILWPFQKVWRYMHQETCVLSDQDNNGIVFGRIYQRWFYIYLDNEEFILTKLER